VSKLLEQRVQDIVSRDEHVIVDLGGMNYVSSAGLRCFIILAKHARSKQKIIALVALQDEVSEIFEISGLLALFKVYGTVDDAVAALPR
jgi:anti-anti-sigma factor